MAAGDGSRWSDEARIWLHVDPTTNAAQVALSTSSPYFNNPGARTTHLREGNLRSRYESTSCPVTHRRCCCKSTDSRRQRRDALVEVATA